MFVLSRPFRLLMACSLLFPPRPVVSQPAPSDLDANQFAQMIIANESSSGSNDNTHWMFEREKEESGKKQTERVVETQAGDIGRLMSVNGRTLSAEEQREEDQRLEDLIRSPRKLRQLQKEKAEDSDRAQRLFKMLPDAFSFSFGERRRDLVKLTFVPNPEFHPPSREARVFHAMQGQMWVATKEKRLVEISGRLIHDVKFGGGLLGHLDQGGEFYVRQSEVEPGYWALTAMTVDMKGKALLFKTIGVQQRERRIAFHRVPDNLTPAEAARILRDQPRQTDGRAR